VFGAASKLDTPHAFSNTLCNADSLCAARVEEENAECFGKVPHKIRGTDELGYLRRKSCVDPLAESGFTLRYIGLEEAEGEEVAVAGPSPGLSAEEVKEGFVPEQTRGRIKKRYDQIPLLPYAELGAGTRRWCSPGEAHIV